MLILKYCDYLTHMISTIRHPGKRHIRHNPPPTSCLTTFHDIRASTVDDAPQASVAFYHIAPLYPPTACWIPWQLTIKKRDSSTWAVAKANNFRSAVQENVLVFFPPKCLSHESARGG
jgi:hypothetical protein